MNIKSKKFSGLITELTEIWLTWMSKNKLSHDHTISYSLRRKYAEECEVLINCEYEVVEELDEFFKLKHG